MIEYYKEYSSTRKKAILVLILLVGYLAGIYFLMMYTMFRSNRQGHRRTFWTLIVLLLAPTAATQLCVPFVALAYLSNPPAPRRPLYTRKQFVMIVSVVTLIYAFVAYFLVNFLLLILTNMSLFDIRHKTIFTSPFITAEETALRIQRSGVFQENIRKGWERARDRRIVFGCIGRDIAANLPNERIRLETIGRAFRDYRIVLFENDSKDGTRAILRQWAEENPRVDLLSCCEDGECECRLNIQNLYFIETNHNSTQRIEKMSAFRQRVLSHIKHHYGDYDYLMVKDLDLLGGIYLDGLMTTFARDDWDMVFARGLTVLFISPHYFLYDPLAFLRKDEPFDSAFSYNIVSNYYQFQSMHIDRHLKNTTLDSPWVECRSGFNGLAIYRMKSLQDASYVPGFRCEHIALHFDMAQKSHDRVFMNPAMVLFAGKQGPPVNKYLYDMIMSGSLAVEGSSSPPPIPAGVASSAQSP